MSTLPTVVFIDDEERILRSLRMLFRGRAEVLATTSATEVYGWVRTRPVHVVVSDQRMPGATGVEVLREVARLSPPTMRILLTGYADLEAVTASVNEGEIFRFVEKPWDGPYLVDAVLRAAETARQDLEAAAQPVPAREPAPVATAAQVLVLDPAATMAATVRELLPASIAVKAAADVEQALHELARRETAVVIAVLTDATGDVVDAIKRLKALRPATLVIAVSSIRDSRLAIGLINEGQIFRFLLAPPVRELLRRCLISALERHAQLRTTPRLLRRHEVEAPRAPAPSLPGRLLDAWRRLREGVGR
ncbi:response regulator [Dokdonella koreensis]|uniref:Response regulator n=1 Tax=Dokdonella koreensis DS-123 TaxID=1300342 RepID=A0A167H172_9GAMM|nr:response regulator [Dokdonella koreensis]ANB18476.1 Response regulator [Dokdonella koreensis DS-123]